METKDLIDVALGKFPETTRGEWMLTAAGAAIHRDAHVCDGAEITADVIVRRGWIGERARIYGGTIEGGIIERQPLTVIGFLPWQATVCAPSALAIGCERHTFTEWREQLDEIAAKHGVGAATKAKVLRVIDIAEAWHAENPIKPEQESASTQ